MLKDSLVRGCALSLVLFLAVAIVGYVITGVAMFWYLPEAAAVILVGVAAFRKLEDSHPSREGKLRD